MYDYENITMTIEEIGMDGAINLGDVSLSTAYRVRREINRRLEHEGYDWRVKLKIDRNDRLPYSLIAISKEEYNSKIVSIQLDSNRKGER